MILRAEFYPKSGITLECNAPKDMEVLGFAYPQGAYGYSPTYEIYVRSESFAEVPEGQEPPEIPPFIYTQKMIEGL